MKDSFCPVPWVNFSLDTDGSIRPCCKFKHRTNPSEYQFPLLGPEKSLEEVWNSDSMVDLRQAFLNGEKPSDCSACYEEEQAGMESLRQTFMLFRKIPETDFTNLRPAAPLALDLKLSNHCNLKCRICGPIASNSLLMELREMKRLEPEYEANRAYYRSKKITGKESSLVQFNKWLHSVVHVEIYGGEPFLCPESLEVEKLIIESGRQSEISMIYNTNISIFSEERVKNWQHFRRVQLNLSLDDIDQRLHYQRFPSDWELVKKNLASYHAFSYPNVQFYIYCSVSMYNIWHLDEFVRYCSQQYPKFIIIMNIVHDTRLRVTSLPLFAKLMVEKKLRRLLDDKENGNCTADQIEAVINFMNLPGSPDHLREFFRDVTLFDKKREQDFRKVFPEYAGVLTLSSAMEP